METVLTIGNMTFSPDGLVSCIMMCSLLIITFVLIALLDKLF